MVVDHVGLFFFPQYHFFREIGRLAFPLFAWLIANGAVFTHDIRAYIGRIFLLAVVSQIPFTLANQFIGNSWWYFNVVFTLLLGLLCIWVIRSTTSKVLWFLTIALGCFLAFAFNTDYGVEGVLAITGFYFFFDSFALLLAYQSVILGVFTYASYLASIHGQSFIGRIYPASSDEFIGILSLFIIFLYNKKPGIRTERLFYYFYPLQYILIYIFQLLLIR